MKSIIILGILFFWLSCSPTQPDSDTSADDTASDTSNQETPSQVPIINIIPPPAETLYISMTGDSVSITDSLPDTTGGTD